MLGQGSLQPAFSLLGPTWCGNRPASTHARRTDARWRAPAAACVLRPAASAGRHTCVGAVLHAGAVDGACAEAESVPYVLVTCIGGHSEAQRQTRGLDAHVAHPGGTACAAGTPLLLVFTSETRLARPSLHAHPFIIPRANRPAPATPIEPGTSLINSRRPTGTASSSNFQTHFGRTYTTY